MSVTARAVRAVTFAAAAQVCPAGCVSASEFRRVAEITASQDLGCGAGQVHLEADRPWAYRASGCGRLGWYRCHAHRMTLCCRPVEGEAELRAPFIPHRFGGHVTGGGQVCDQIQSP